MSDFVTLGDYISVQKGKTPLLVPYFGNDAEIYLSPEHLRNNSDGTAAKASSDAVRVSDGDTVLLWDGSNAGEFFKAKKGLVASTMARIGHSAKFRPDFFFHLLKHSERIPKNQTNGTGIPHVDKEILEAIQVFCPSESEQNSTAKILDTLDTTIRQTEAIIAKLQQVKQGLLHDLLTRGIDTNGQLHPPVEQAPYLYKESPLGWIPREWDIKPISDIGEVVTGSTPPSSDSLAWGDHLPFVTPVDIVSDASIILTKRYVSKRGRKYMRLLPPKTSLVVCIGSTIGKVGITGIECCTNQQINAVIPKVDFDADFVYCAIRHHIYQLRSMAGLQAVPIVNKSSFGEMLMPMPASIEQREIAKRVYTASRRITKENSELEKLKQQKSALMDDLLTGHVRVTSLLSGGNPSSEELERKKSA